MLKEEFEKVDPGRGITWFSGMDVDNEIGPDILSINWETNENRELEKILHQIKLTIQNI